MHFVYVDDSGDGEVACFSALIIPADDWRVALDHLLGARQQMRASDGIYMKAEIHSTAWNAKKGRIARHPISKERRVQLYDFFLASIAMLPGAQLINACVPADEKDRAFEWMLNRIQTNMRKAGSRCVIFSDEGKSYDSIRRRIGIFNYIPSRHGAREDGNPARNLTADRLIEDLVYRDSANSIFIQAADACAYALLRRERHLASKNSLGLHESFFILERIMVKEAHRRDPYGIIR